MTRFAHDLTLIDVLLTSVFIFLFDGGPDGLARPVQQPTALRPERALFLIVFFGISTWMLS